ncbi:MAG: hypothetical protein WKF37_07580 [Bryobacteraceae bacterium]
METVNAGSGDPLAFATANPAFNQVLLTAKRPAELGNETTYSVTFSTGAQLAGSVAGATFSGGQDAARIAPGTLVTVLGEGLTTDTATAPLQANDLPKSLGRTEVYFDGIAAPLLYVSPKQINAQIPFEVSDSYSVNAYVRSIHSDGSIRITTAIAVPVVPQNPGIFARPGADPRPAIAYHGSSFATGVISVDGAIKENDVATVIIESREYKYTVKKGDNLTIVRDALIGAINQDDKVSASPAGQFTRILLRAKVAGAAGLGITYSAKANDGNSLILTALSPTFAAPAGRARPSQKRTPLYRARRSWYMQRVLDSFSRTRQSWRPRPVQSMMARSSTRQTALWTIQSRGARRRMCFSRASRWVQLVFMRYASN